MAASEPGREGIWSSEKGVSAPFPTNQPRSLDPVPARRSVESAIVCGMCNHAIAKRNCGVLEFPQDSAGCEHWKGWQLSAHRPDCVPGGVWKVADPRQSAQPSLSRRLELLPAIIECPHCAVPNLFDPTRLNVRVDQLVAREDRLRRHNHVEGIAPQIGAT